MARVSAPNLARRCDLEVLAGHSRRTVSMVYLCKQATTASDVQDLLAFQKVYGIFEVYHALFRQPVS